MSITDKSGSEDHESIGRKAAEWIVQRDDGLSAGEAAELARWLAADPRHAAAFARLEAAARLLEGLRGLPVREPAPVVRFPLSRALIAAAAAVVLAIPAWRLGAERVVFSGSYATTAAGHQRAVLPDGSVINLESDTTVQVQFTSAERRVTLSKGDAHFEVSRNPARPFVVDADRVVVRAVGTAFEIRRGEGRVEVAVAQGQVQLKSNGELAGSPMPTEDTPFLAPASGTGRTTQGGIGRVPVLLSSGQRVVIPTSVFSAPMA